MSYPPINHPVVGRDGLLTVPWRNYLQTLSAGIVPGATAINQLTGEVTAGPGVGAQVATIANNAVTYAKLQDMPASTLLGRGQGGGTGDPQEITLGAGLSMAGTVLSATASGSGSSGTALAWLEESSGDSYYQMLGTSVAADDTVCSPLTDGDPTQPELIFASGDVVMVCA